MPKLVSQNLTDATVRNAKPRETRYDLYDAGLRGFGLRVAVAGTKTWFVMRRINGRMTRVSLGRYPEWPLSDARAEAARLLRDMSQGVLPREQKPDLFENVVEEWYARDQQKNKSFKQVKNAMDLHALPAFKKMPLASISKRDILRLIDKIADSGAPIQANRLLAFLRRFFNWSIERDLLTQNPTIGIKTVGTIKSRERVLSIDELQAILRVVKDMGYPWGPLVTILALTGQRLKEVAEAQWDEFDMGRREWVIPGARAKNGRAHVVHLSEHVIEVLNHIPRSNSHGWLFSTTGTTPVSGYSKAKKRLDKFSGVTGWTFHDLRRSFATHATEKLKVPPAIVDKILNHVSGTVTGVAAVYQRGEYLDDRRDALDEWANYVAENRPFV